MLKLLKKLNFLRILVDGINSISESNTSFSVYDTLSFFLVPLVISAVLVWQEIYLTEDFRGLLLNAYAIFAGLLFGLQVFIFDIVSRVRELKTTVQAAKLKISKIKFLSRDVSFEILICLLGSVILIISGAFPSSMILSSQLFALASFYIFVLFLFSLILILKSVHILLAEEISYQERRIDEFM